MIQSSFGLIALIHVSISGFCFIDGDRSWKYCRFHEKLWGHDHCRILLRKVSYYQPYYLPAREGKAQSRNEKHILSMSKKDKIADGSLRRFCVSHSPFKGADYCGEKLGRGRVISGRLANRFGSRFGTNTKLLRGDIGPISSPCDYLDTACDDDDDDAGAAETMPSHCPYGKSFNLCLLLVTFLSVCV